MPANIRASVTLRLSPEQAAAVLALLYHVDGDLNEPIVGSLREVRMALNDARADILVVDPYVGMVNVHASTKTLPGEAAEPISRRSRTLKERVDQS